MHFDRALRTRRPLHHHLIASIPRVNIPAVSRTTAFATLGLKHVHVTSGAWQLLTPECIRVNETQWLVSHRFQPTTTAPRTTAANANMPAIALQPVSVSTFSSPAGVSAPLICVNVSGCAASAQQCQQHTRPWCS